MPSKLPVNLKYFLNSKDKTGEGKRKIVQWPLYWRKYCFLKTLKATCKGHYAGESSGRVCLSRTWGFSVYITQLFSKIPVDKLSLSFCGESWSNNFRSTHKVAIILHMTFSNRLQFGKMLNIHFRIKIWFKMWIKESKYHQQLIRQYNVT